LLAFFGHADALEERARALRSERCSIENLSSVARVASINPVDHSTKWHLIEARCMEQRGEQRTRTLSPVIECSTA
jgi:hypothetical protein